MGDATSSVALDAAVHHAHVRAQAGACSCAARACACSTTTGREYLDFVSGIGAVNLGHAHPAVADGGLRAGRASSCT